MFLRKQLVPPYIFQKNTVVKHSMVTSRSCGHLLLLTFEWSQLNCHVSMVTVQRSCFHGHDLMVIQWSCFNCHSLLVVFHWSRFNSQISVVTIQRSRFSGHVSMSRLYGHVSVVTIERSRFSRHVLKATFQWSRFNDHLDHGHVLMITLQKPHFVVPFQWSRSKATLVVTFLNSV